jgi:Uma2 family endonuclease
MAAPTLPRHTLEMTEDEYLSTLANSRRFEFDNGAVAAKRGPYMTQKGHVAIAEELSAAFHSYRRVAGGFAGQTPTTNISNGPDRQYRLPDFGYWALGQAVGGGIFTVPTAAVEIVSPDQDLHELRAKCRLYRDRGVLVVWLIHPQGRWVEAFDELHDGTRLPPDGALESRHLPGFSLRIAGLFGVLDTLPE